MSQNDGKNLTCTKHPYFHELSVHSKELKWRNFQMWDRMLTATIFSHLYDISMKWIDYEIIYDKLIKISHLFKNFFAPFHVHIWVHFSLYQYIGQFEFEFHFPMNQNVVQIQNRANIVAQNVVVHAIIHFPWRKYLFGLLNVCHIISTFDLYIRSLLLNRCNTFTHHAIPNSDASFLPAKYLVDHQNLDGSALFSHFHYHLSPQLDIHPNGIRLSSTYRTCKYD